MWELRPTRYSGLLSAFGTPSFWAVLRASAICSSIVGGVSGSSRAKRTVYVCCIHERYDPLGDSALGFEALSAYEDRDAFVDGLSGPVSVATSSEEGAHVEHGPSEPSAIDDRGDSSGTFTTDTAGLLEVSRPSVVRLKDGDRFEFRIGPVRKQLDGADLRMLAYNGSIPGPILHVDQGSEITVEVTNEGDVEATVHWHGLRLENRYDGVPHDTQAPIGIGETFTYKVQFPDAGFYWYHPHIREDFGLEMGLYGTIIVEPTDATYWPEVDRQLSITLDDLLVEDGHIATFNKAGPNFTAMGRFGNVMLINGETSFAGDAAPGEVVRLYLVNTANTRIFNFALPGARAKLVG